MKKYLFNISIFLFIFFILSILNGNRLSYYFGSNQYKIKINDFEGKKLDENFNTVFFGSSHIYRQVDVNLFDAKNKKHSTKSYNFGLPGCFALEQLYLLENFLQENPQIKNVFLELQAPKRIDERNFKSKRSQYYFDFKRIKLLISMLDFKDLSRFKHNFKSIFLNVINYRNTWYNGDDRIYVGIENSLTDNGYSALSGPASKFQNNEVQKKRRESFLRNAEKIKRNLKKNIRKKLSNKDKIYLRYLKQMNINNASLYVVCHPLKHRLATTSFEGINIISLDKIKWNKLVNDSGYYFDKGHLSKKGSEFFTNDISSKFNEVNNRK